MRFQRTAGVAVLLTIATVSVASVAMAALPTWGTARPTTFAAPRGGTPDDRIMSISCPSDGDCTAVGYYYGGTAFMQSSVDGVWGDAETLVLPAGLSPAATASWLNSVSCSSAGNCTAVGRYRNESNAYNSLTVTSTGGVWAEAEIVAFAAGVPNAKPDDSLYSVSCTAPGYCTAVGYFNDINWDQRAFSITSTAGVWTEGEPATFGAGVQDSSPLEQFYSVSCTSAGNCTAVGTFQNSNGDFESFAQTSTSGVWAEAITAAFAAGVQASAPWDSLQSVSCTAAGECVAVGYFTDANYDQQAFAMTMTGGVWQTAVPSPFAAGVQSTSPYATLWSVSCSSTGECVAVGQFEDASGYRRAFSQRLDGGTWNNGVPTEFAPGVENATPASSLQAVSCTSTGNCAATGRFKTVDGNAGVFVYTMTDGVWALAKKIAFAAGIEHAAPIAYYETATSISCSSDGECTAAGSFHHASGWQEAYTVSSSIPADPPVEPPVLPPTGVSTTVWPALVLMMAGAALVAISTSTRGARRTRA